MPKRLNIREYHGDTCKMLAIVQAALSLIPIGRQAIFISWLEIFARSQEIIPSTSKLTPTEVREAISYAFPIYKNNRKRCGLVKLNTKAPYIVLRSRGLRLQNIEHIRAML